MIIFPGTRENCGRVCVQAVTRRWSSEGVGSTGDIGTLHTQLTSVYRKKDGAGRVLPGAK